MYTMSLPNAALASLLGHVDGVDQRGLGMHHAHAASAAAARGLDDHRVADGAAILMISLASSGSGAARAGHAGHAGGLHRAWRSTLSPIRRMVRARADEDEAGFLDALGEVGVLGEESRSRGGSPRRR
jgi:hypothetical protein